MVSIRGTKRLWVYWTKIGIIGAIIIVCAVSFFSYNSHDPSFFCVDSRQYAPTNWCGYGGAVIAAFFFYLFGSASFLVFVPLLCALFIVINDSLKKEWERVVAGLYLLVCVSMWCALQRCDFMCPLYPGGAVGLSLVHMFVDLFDHIGCYVFVHTGIVVSCVLLFRFYLVLCVYYLYQMIFYCCMIMQQYHVFERATYFFWLMIQFLCVRPYQLCIAFIHSLLDGTAFEDTDLLIPDDEQHEFFMNQECENIIAFNTRESVEKNETVFIGSTKEKVENKEGEFAISDKTREYSVPSLDVFISDSDNERTCDLEKELKARAVVLQDKLRRFGINGEVTAIKRGPVVTLFEYQPEADTKLSKIIALEDDLAMALSAMSIRIIAPIPGRSVVGFEVANVHRNDVLFSHIVTSIEYKKNTAVLPLILGKGTVGEIVIVDLARMPHLLIAGSTGSGKSVALNGMLISLLCKRSPDELKLILIDPKRLEFSAFADIAHLLFPIVTNSYHAVPVLKWVVQEMERRYEVMAECGAKSSCDYNERIRGTEREQLPIIVVVIDELADLMLTTGREIEDLIARITQMARAAGIHMIVATQRPSVDVVTGLIKANFPSRISFRVASRVDSRTILDSIGADRLLGRGDMLFLDATTSFLRRVHGAKIADEEIEHVVSHIKSQRSVCYLGFDVLTTKSNQGLLPDDDVLYKDVCTFLGEVDEVSISLLQRRFRIGFNRSARIIDMLESQGLIMPTDGSKTRKVIR